MKKKHIIVLTIALLLVAGWVWRYVTMNAYFDSLVTLEKETYQIGDVVPFEDDLGEGSANLNGYSLRVDNFEVQDFDAYVESIAFEPDEYYTPGERVALLYITLFNEDSDADGVMLTDFQLRGVDTIIYLDWDLLTAANPVLGENYGIKLSPGTEYSIVLPYKLQEEFFGSWTWNHFENYNLYFRVTVHPTEKIIEVQ